MNRNRQDQTKVIGDIRALVALALEERIFILPKGLDDDPVILELAVIFKAVVVSRDNFQEWIWTKAKNNTLTFVG